MQHIGIGLLALIAGVGVFLRPAASDAAAPGCDNGVPIGGTACQWQGDSVQYRCLVGSVPGASKWQAEGCNGGSCQGVACQGGQGGAPGCDNGVVIGGTACKSQGDAVQYRCMAGSRPGASIWAAESCGASTCVGSACQGAAAGCGGQNRACCANRKCGQGLVCSAANSCVVPHSGSCGVVGEACCSDVPYPNNCVTGVCITGVCKQCGGQDQRCCGKQGEPNLCEFGLECRWDAQKGQGCYPTASCGWAGEACCPNVAYPNNCVGAHMCVQGKCQPCGGSGQACCEKGGPPSCNDWGNECRWDAQRGRRGCFPRTVCGERGQACCKPAPGNDGCWGGSACRAQTCVGCGELNKPCCWNGACNQGLACLQQGSDNRCVQAAPAKVPK